MRSEEVLTLSATQLAEAIRKRAVTSEEAVRDVLEAMEEKDGQLHAYITTWKDKAIDEARNCDETIRRIYEKQQDPEEEIAALPPLLGVPVAVKDNLMTKDGHTTCGSKMLKNFIAPYSATCVEKLQKAGAIIVGKTNMDEFGMGSSTENSFFGTTHHPLDPSRVPGGSSGGSAAAVASGMAFAALGTDTGGSVRQPAAFCGLYGLRPTYGTVSRHGLVAFASSMDTAGPITRSSRDAAVVYNIVKGADPKDQTSVSSPDVDLQAMEEYRFDGRRIAIPMQLLYGTSTEGAACPEVMEAFRRARDFCARSGAVVEEVDMPILEYAVAIYYILSSAEASSNLSRYDGIRYGYRDPEVTDASDMYRRTRTSGFGIEVRRRILLGNFVLSSEHFEDCYRQAERARTLVRRAFDEVFSKYDLILCPTSPMTAPALGELQKDPLTTYIADLSTIPASLAGIPAVSIPFGQDPSGLPAAIQLMGPQFGEQEILGAARFFERNARFAEEGGGA